MPKTLGWVQTPAQSWFSAEIFIQLKKCTSKNVEADRVKAESNPNKTNKWKKEQAKAEKKHKECTGGNMGKEQG